MSYRNLNEKKEEEEHDILKNYHGALAKSEKKKKSGGFQSMGKLTEKYSVHFDRLKSYY